MHGDAGRAWIGRERHPRGNTVPYGEAGRAGLGVVIEKDRLDRRDANAGLESRWTHDGDIHLIKGMLCVDCHRNGADHMMVRGYEGEFEVKAFDVPAVLKVVVQLGREVAVGLFATWLYDKLKGGRARRLRVDRMQVEITEGEIKRVLLERIEEEE